MEIINSQPADIDQIVDLYKIAASYMKERFHICFPDFDRTMVAAEIEEKRQWKMIIDGQIACIWAITFSDPQIWEEKDADPAIYIHRITTAPAFRGQKLVEAIVRWAKAYAAEHHKKYIRLDTVGENKKLVAHYQQCGFQYLGLVTLKNTTGLPAHYQLDRVSLLELAL